MNEPGPFLKKPLKERSVVNAKAGLARSTYPQPSIAMSQRKRGGIFWNLGGEADDVRAFESLKTLRLNVIARAGNIVNVAVNSVLKMALEPKVENDYRKTELALHQLDA